MKFEYPKFIGQNKDGYYKGIVEQIETAKNYDILDLCNRRRCMWVLSIFSGYRQIGCFKVKNPHNFKEGDLVIIKINNGRVVMVKKEFITIDNIRDVFKD